MATEGYTYRKPDGSLCGMAYVSPEGAQSGAAFCNSTGGSIELPKGWDLAYRDGFRIVPCKLTATGPTRPSWKEYQRG